MPYPEQLVAPMRAELTRIGVTELRSPEEVDDVFGDAPEGTTMLVVNSVCGCAAANARPAITMALRTDVVPSRFVTVFAGQDLEATARAREYMPGIPPSSPFIALFRGADPVYVLERRHIEGRTASAIATDLVDAFQKYCSDAASGDGADTTTGVQSPEVAEKRSDDLPPTFRSIL
ncbi:MAG: BrxA/BrxB family bacilliredoxin [Rhodothermales bacterium]|nr:BrxA/BrxB family bacilliredoxin [Rhodothermales bacterium]